MSRIPITGAETDALTSLGFVLGVLLVGAVGQEARAQAVIGGDWRADVDSVADRLVEAGLTPGLSFAVAYGDWVVHAGGSGTADLETGRAADGDTRFYIASTTKSFTALAVARAMERGDLDPEAPVSRYLPEVEFPQGVPRDSITLQDLLLMRHGLSGRGPVVLLTAYLGEEDRSRLPPLVRFHEPTDDPPGSFDYNNLGYNLLGLVLEARYGQGWKEVVRAEVLEPLGMSGTTAYRSRVPPGGIAMPHEATPEGFARIALAKEDANLHAAGGHFASARDLARYLAAHLGGGVVDGRRRLPEGPVRATHVPRIPQDREFGPYHRHGWGYGWDVGTFEGDTLLHRFGGFGGYYSHVSFMPGENAGVAVVANGGGLSARAANTLANYVYARLSGDEGAAERRATELDSLVARGERVRSRIAEHMDERRARLEPLPRPLSSYAGVYEHPVLGRMEWREMAGGLEMRIGIVHSRAEVYDADANELRVELGGSGTVASFDVPAGDSAAASVTVAGHTFERTD